MENSELSIPTPPAGSEQPLAATSAPAAPRSAPTPLENPFGERPGDRPRRRRTLRERIGGAIAAVVALVAKFFAAIKGLILLLPKAKLLTTSGTALISVAAYSLFFGWWFAVGFVVLLFVHEMGHVFQLRREGVKASAPMFIPFMGAVITARSLGENALAEARVGLAGPILGTAGAAACLVVAELTNSDFFRALAYIGFFLNLFNLLPIVPLDGGRAMAAMAPWMWFVGFGVLVALALLFPNPILFIIVFFAGYELYRRWQARKSGSVAQAAYYRVAPRHRLIVGTVYIGLILLIVLGMEHSHILSSGGHSFRGL
ncbi:MAG TPA: site-2 protease family protein [Solirubrobacteraceae bacterium]|jgi:Zn-dependent protease|nr:site-2 protease family protein [Solirubrobacteraceae bacterium]